MLPNNSYSVPSIDIPSIENLFSVLVMNVIDETCNNVQAILIENIVDIRDDENENSFDKPKFASESKLEPKLELKTSSSIQG